MAKPKSKKPAALKAVGAGPTRSTRQALGAGSEQGQATLDQVQPETPPRRRRSSRSEPVDIEIFAFGDQEDDQDLPEGFSPMPQAKGASGLTLFDALDHLQQRERLSKETLWGALPTRFVEATAIPLSVVSKLCSERDDRDAFIFNLTPSDEAIFANPLARAYVSRPELVASMQEMLRAQQLSPTLAQSLVGSSEFSIAPFMVARQAFWEAFFDYLRPAHALAMGSFGSAAAIHDPFDDSSQSLLGQTPFTVFAGAMLPHFLQSGEGKAYRVLKVSVPSLESSLNAHLQSLRQLRDAAAKTKSNWLIGAWLNYRNLYLLQVAGKAWCERHLRALSEGVSVGAK